DTAGNVGGSDFTANPFVVEQAGRNGEVIQNGFSVYDAGGGVHTIQYEFVKQADSTWTLHASIDPADGVMLDAEVAGITFGPNGAFVGVAGTGTGDANLTVQLEGQATPLTFEIDLLGGIGTGSALTSFTGSS